MVKDKNVDITYKCVNCNKLIMVRVGSVLLLEYIKTYQRCEKCIKDLK